MKNKEKVSHIVKWIRDYADMADIKTLIVGVSGGIDSSVVSTLCAMTGLNTILVELPIKIYDKNGVAANHINYLKERYSNINHEIVNLTESFNNITKTFENQTDLKASKDFELSLANMASRLRMLTLYTYSNSFKGLVVGTGNKVEDFGLCFFSVGGDGVCDISPIGDLMKSEIYSIAEYLNLIPEVIKAIPTDGLWDDNRTDEMQIGATYDELERAMKFIDDKKAGIYNETIVYMNEDIKNLTIREQQVLDIYTKRHSANKHKMLPIPICKINF